MVKAVNWNQIEDPIDLEVWHRMTSNFWLPEKVPLSNDKKSWNLLTDAERTAVKKTFAGLTLLDTIQGTIGAPTFLGMPDITPHEEANYTFIGAMESIHAKSYSSIFSTLCSTSEINEVFRWSEESETLQHKADLTLEHYDRENRTEGRDWINEGSALVASVFLESFLFYSGFYVPFKLASQGRLTNTADIIRLILRDEAVHGYYLGYKFQQRFPAEWRADLGLYVRNWMLRLYENECLYAQELYDEVGWTENVKTYLRYNANKALQNLGYDPIFSPEETQVEPAILSSMTPDANESHDFFSGSGSAYVIGTVEETDDEDWG